MSSRERRARAVEAGTADPAPAPAPAGLTAPLIAAGGVDVPPRPPPAAPTSRATQLHLFPLTRKGRCSMSPYLFSADLGVTELGRQARKTTTVSDAMDAYAAQLIAEFADARAAGRFDLMNLIRDHAQAIDPDLLAELDGFDYPAAA